MHPLDMFERIHVINLSSRADRRAEMAEQLQRIGRSIDTPTVRVFDAVRPAAAGPFSTIGTRGCFTRHLGILRDARAAGLSSGTAAAELGYQRASRTDIRPRLDRPDAWHARDRLGPAPRAEPSSCRERGQMIT